MKHGDKAKGKASKASKTSDKKASKASGVEKSKASSKGREAKASSKAQGSREKSVPKAAKSAAGKGSSSKAGSGKASSGKASAPARPSDGNGGSRARLTTEDVSFGNPVVAAAFKRAIKKYSNAFRRLTD